MKRLLLFSITLLLAGGLFIQDSRAEDYTRWHLPEGALARFGKGEVGVAGGGRDHAVAYSPDGTRLAVTSSIGVWLYDVTTGAEIALLTGHTDRVTSVAFPPDGTTLASGSDDGTILLWDMVPYITPSPRADWCRSIQTVVISFQLQENGKTASICRDEANTLVYSFGILGGEPELEYRGPILGQISVGATL